MPKQHVSLTFYTPDWAWCEVRNPGRKTRSGEKCKFCKEIKGTSTGYYCLIYGQSLLVRDGVVEKCRPCLTEVKQYQSDSPNENNQVIIEDAFERYKKAFDSLRKEGFPEDMAYDLAKQEAKNDWRPF